MADEEDINRTCIVFVVDTEHYSGNFQEPLAEYITRGPQEEDWICRDKKGKEIMEGDNDKGWVSSVGIPWPEYFGEGHCGSGPEIMFDTPGKGIMGSVGVCFEKLTKEQVAILTERAFYFCNNAREISGKSYVAEKIPFIGVRCFKRKVRKSKDEAYLGD